MSNEAEGKEVFEGMFSGQTVDWKSPEARITGDTGLHVLTDGEIESLLAYSFEQIKGQLVGCPQLVKADYAMMVRSSYLYTLATQYNEDAAKGLWGEDGTRVRFFVVYRPWDTFPRLVMLEGGDEIYRNTDNQISMAFTVRNTCFGAILFELRSGYCVRISKEPIDGVGTHDQFCDLDLFRLQKKASVL